MADLLPGWVWCAVPYLVPLLVLRSILSALRMVVAILGLIPAVRQAWVNAWAPLPRHRRKASPRRR